MQANGSVNISMMDYVPAQLYAVPISYWNNIDDAIRTVNFNNGTKVNLMIGFRAESYPIQWHYLFSLNVLPGVEVRYCILNPSVLEPNMTRLNHDKYFVTDTTFWTSSANWVGDYFAATADVSINILNNGPVLARARAIFDRDWTASYTVPIPYPDPNPGVAAAGVSYAGQSLQYRAWL